MSDLRERLFREILFLKWFLLIIGLPNSSPGRWYWVKRFWKIVCFMLTLQAHVYIFIERSYRYINLSFVVDMDALMTIGNRLNRLVGIVFVYTLLLLKWESAATSLCCMLEPTYLMFNRPDLLYLRLYSMVGLAWIFIAGNVAAACALYWEIFVQKLRPIYLINCFYQFIRVESQMFSTASSVLFFILGQVLVVFYKHMARKSDLKVNELLSIHHQLSVATKHLTNCFTPILLTSCVHIFLSLIFYSQSFLSLVCVYNQLSQTIWDGLWILDCFIRLWLICSTADSIRQSSIDCINTLRFLRDASLQTRSVSERNKITLDIVEMYQIQPDFNIFGCVNISRSLIMQMLGSLLTILIFLFQFGLRGWASEISIKE